MKHLATLAAMILIVGASSGCPLLGVGASTVTIVNDTEHTIPFVGAVGTRTIDGFSAFPGLMTNYAAQPIEPGEPLDFFLTVDDAWVFLVFVDLDGFSGYTTPLTLVDFAESIDRFPGRFEEVIADSGGPLRRGDHLEIRVFERTDGTLDFESTTFPDRTVP